MTIDELRKALDLVISTCGEEVKNNQVYLRNHEGTVENTRYTRPLFHCLDGTFGGVVCVLQSLSSASDETVEKIEKAVRRNEEEITAIYLGTDEGETK